ncbi:MAG: hypothetical protein L3K04_04285, partial [Thermoplasmata archaeon]|nr:hypothetical protein [Thermoplasmata archaeon]
MGVLPGWTRVQGKTAWYVVQGPTAGLAAAWTEFHRKVAVAAPGRPDGPPGYVFACRPEDHAGAADSKVLTIMYLP